MADAMNLDVLLAEIEKCKDKLKDYSEIIKKLTCDDPSRSRIHQVNDNEAEKKEDGQSNRMSGDKWKPVGDSKVDKVNDNEADMKEEGEISDVATDKWKPIGQPQSSPELVPSQKRDRENTQRKDREDKKRKKRESAHKKDRKDTHKKNKEGHKRRHQEDTQLKESNQRKDKEISHKKSKEHAQRRKREDYHKKHKENGHRKDKENIGLKDKENAQKRDRENHQLEEPPAKLHIQSSVLASTREAKNREEVLQEQSKDEEGMKRNRRMFGLLLGTLKKFKTESKTQEVKRAQRKVSEKKLRKKAEKARRKYKKEARRHTQKVHLEHLEVENEQKMEVLQEYAVLEEELRKLKNFIPTRTEPRVFWGPRHITKLEETEVRVIDETTEESVTWSDTDMQTCMETVVID